MGMAGTHLSVENTAITIRSNGAIRLTGPCGEKHFVWPDEADALAQKLVEAAEEGRKQQASHRQGDLTVEVKNYS